MIKQIQCCVEQSKPEPKPFPKLMKLKDINTDQTVIALMRDADTGTILVSENFGGYRVGDIKACFNTERFWEDYNEPLTIQNV